MPRKAIDYSKTIIYKLIKNDDYNNDNIYVGSTTDFTRRKSTHKRTCCNEKCKGYYTKVYKIIRDNGGWSEWTMLEIEKYPCNDSNEARKREEYWRCELNARLNSVRAFTTEEQRKQIAKQYTIKIAEEKKKYKLDNVDKNKQYEIDKMKQLDIDITNKIKQYYIDNPNIDISNRIKQYYIDNPNDKKDKRIRYMLLKEQLELLKLLKEKRKEIKDII